MFVAKYEIDLEVKLNWIYYILLWTKHMLLEFCTIKILKYFLHTAIVVALDTYTLDSLVQHR